LLSDDAKRQHWRVVPGIFDLNGAPVLVFVLYVTGLRAKWFSKIAQFEDDSIDESESRPT
jgi:hypothetical protein